MEQSDKSFWNYIKSESLKEKEDKLNKHIGLKSTEILVKIAIFLNRDDLIEDICCNWDLIENSKGELAAKQLVEEIKILRIKGILK